MRQKLAKKHYFVITFLCFVLLGVVILYRYHVKEPDEGVTFDKLYADLKDVNKRESAYYRLIQHKQKAGDYLARTLPSEGDDLIKMYALQIIGFSGCTKCEGSLLQYVEYPDWHVRYFALDTLNKLGYDNIINISKKVLTADTNDSLIIGALTIIGERGALEDIAFMENLLKDKRYTVGVYKKVLDASVKKIRDRSAKTARGTS